MQPLLFVLAALVSALPRLAAAQTDAGAEIAGPAALARLDEFLTRLAGFDHDGSILVERGGEVVLRAAYGYADRSAGRRHSPDAVFEIGSLAKMFTAAAVLELETRGRLELGDPLVRFLPDAPPDKADLTIEQLLTHTAGLAGDVPAADPWRPDLEVVGRDEVLARIFGQPLDARPGAGWSYSNGGYVLLAAVVEEASEMDFRDFVRTALFAPAGMEHTGFWGTAPAGRASACGHDGLGNVLEDPAERASTWIDLGGGEVWTTLDDLAAWIHALDGGAVLDGDALERMLTPRTGTVSQRDGAYALGCFVQATPRGTRQVHHGGDTPGCGAWLRWFPEDDVLVVTSTNVRHDMVPTQNVVQRVLPGVLFEGAEAPPVPAFESLDAPSPPGLEGSYALASGGRFVLRRIHGRLYVGAEGQDATDALAPASSGVVAERAWHSDAALTALGGALEGDAEALAPILGRDPNPAFPGLLVAELAQLAEPLGGPRGPTLLGTFATGWPRGNPPGQETTLVRVDCERGDFVYAIRWTGRVVAWTESLPMPLATPVPLQRTADGSWVGWKIHTGQALHLRPAPDAIEVEVAGRTTRATRIEPAAVPVRR